MEFSDLWIIKTAKSETPNFVPDEVQEAVKNIVREHPILGHNQEIAFKDEYDEENDITWEDEIEDGEFWVSPKPGFSFDESFAAAPHTSHTYNIEDMMNDILTLRPCETDINCDDSGCKGADTSGYTEQSLRKITESLLTKHNLVPLLKKHGLDNHTRRATERLKAWRSFLDRADVGPED